MADDKRRTVRSVAVDCPDRYDDVDEQLLRDYPELKGLIEKKGKS